MSKFFKQIIAPSQKRIGSGNDSDQSSDSENDSQNEGSEQFEEDDSSEDYNFDDLSVKIKINSQEPQRQNVASANSLFSKLFRQVKTTRGPRLRNLKQQVLKPLIWIQRTKFWENIDIVQERNKTYERSGQLTYWVKKISKYADIVEYISNIKKPSVPDFGFQFYENTFLDELRNDNESGDQRYRRKDQRNQQVIEQKNKKHRRKTRKMKQLLGNHLMNNTYDEIMKDQGYKVVMEKKTSRIKFENINNRRGGVILPPKNLLGVQEKSNFNTKRVSFFDQAAFNRDGKGCSADNQISSRGSRNKSVQKYQDSNQKSLTQISSVLNNQSRDVSQAQGQGEQGQGSQKYDINEIKRLILNQAIFQQMQAQKLNIEDLKSELKHIKELDKAKKRDINEFKFRNQKLLNSSQVKIQTV
eukprot:403365119